MKNDKVETDFRKLGLLRRAVKRYRSDGLTDLGKRALNNLDKSIRESDLLRRYVTPRLDNASVEITNDCNLHCGYCTGNSRREHGIGIRYVEPKFYRSIIDQLAKMRVGSVQLNFGGESLMHPDFQELLKYACDARKRGLGFISWFDNGMLFDREVSRYVADYGVNRVIFSVDANKEKNNLCRKGSDYDTIKANILGFKEIRGRSRFPEIWINKIDIEDEQDTNSFLHEWGPIVDLIQVSQLQDSRHQTQNLAKYYTKPTIEIPYCPYYFFYMGVLTDGRIAACCADDDCDTKMGNANDQSLKQIWRSQRYKEMRRQALTNSFKSSPCRECNFWKTRFKPATNTVQVQDYTFEAVYSEHKQYILKGHC